MRLSAEGFPRCFLFVPGSRPERFAKVIASGADAVVLDLEDGVGSEAKEAARRAVGEFLAARPSDLPTCLGVRINAPEEHLGRADLALLIELRDRRPDFLMLPKFEGHAALRVVRRALGEDMPPLVPLVESASGLLSLERELKELCRFAEVGAVMLGGYDLAASLGAAFAFEPLLLARQWLKLVAAAHRLPAIDVPFIDIQDAAGLRAESERVAALGYEAKAAIHPAHVPIIQAVFTPSAEAVEQAEQILAAAAEAKGEAIQLGGRLIDQPVVLAARRLLARARRGAKEREPES